MVIGTITLISMLFFSGNAQQYFLVDQMDKAVKKIVVDKDSKNQILAELEATKGIVKEYYKERKDDLKTLKVINANHESTQADFDAHFKAALADRKHMQQGVMERRLSLRNLVSNDELDQIWAWSEERTLAEKAKLEKKEAKGKVKDSFDKVEALVAKMPDSNKRELVKKALQSYKNANLEFAKALNARNVVDSEIISNKDASLKDLNQLADEMNTLAKESNVALSTLHFQVLENTTEEEWAGIMKEVNKLLH